MYTIDFTNTAAQDPLSAGNVWSNNTQGTGGNLPPGNLGSMRIAAASSGGINIAQHAAAPVVDYNDSFAFVPDVSSGNIRITATVYRAPGYNPSANHEIELILGCATTAGGNHRWIECLWNAQGGTDIVNLDGGPSSFTVIGNSVFSIGPPKDKDVWVAELLRSQKIVRWFVNGTLVCTSNSGLISNLGTGAGIAAFRRDASFGTSNSASLGFRNFKCEAF